MVLESERFVTSRLPISQVNEGEGERERVRERGRERGGERRREKLVLESYL